MAAKIDKNKCTGCGNCKEYCSVNAIEMENNLAVVNDNCVECGACVYQCPNEAVSI